MPDSNVKKEKNLIASVFEWVEVFCMALFVVVLMFTFVCRLVTVDGPSMNNTLHHGDRLIISNLFYTPKTGDVVVLQDATSVEMPQPIIKRVIATEGEIIDIDPATWTVTVTDKDGNTRVLEEAYARRVYALNIPLSLHERIRVNYDDEGNFEAAKLSNLGYAEECGTEKLDDVTVEITYDDGAFGKKKVRVNTETLETEIVDKNGNVTENDAGVTSKYLENMRMPGDGELFAYRNAIPLDEYPHEVKEGHVFVMGDNRNNSLDSRLLGDVDVRTILGKAYVRVLPKPRFGF